MATANIPLAQITKARLKFSSETKWILYNLARRPFQLVGLDLVKRSNARIGMDRLARAAKLGLSPRQVIDGGAFRGLWTAGVAKIFPAAEFVLIEPNPAVQDAISKNVSRLNARVVQAALAESKRKATFNLWQNAETDQSASLLGHVSGEPRQTFEVEVEALDNLCERLSFTPDLIKLDLQGGELAALQGSTMVLQSAEFVILEFGCLDAYIGRTSPRQILDFMYDHDFCLYDIVDFQNRPYDDALCGGDFYFVKNSSRLRSHKGYL